MLEFLRERKIAIQDKQEEDERIKSKIRETIKKKMEGKGLNNSFEEEDIYSLNTSELNSIIDSET